MTEAKTALKRMAIYYLLLAINIIPCANIIPDSFPTRNVSAIYLLSLCVCLILYYSHRVSRAGGLSALMKALPWLALLLILLRGIKYSVFAHVGVLDRQTWYLYYIPMLLLPLFLFYISLLVSPKKDFHIPKGWYAVSALSVIFIILVLTNDIHQLVFKFNPGFLNWDHDYSYGRLFYLITAWQYVLYISSIIILVVKCRIGSAKKSAWIFLIPFAIGVVMNVLLLTDKMPVLNGSHIIEFPEAFIFTVACVLECCMQLGLIPTNKDYAKLFRKFSISAQIIDKNGTPVYLSSSAAELTKEQFELQSSARIGEHTVLHKMKIPGGFGFWQDDMTELDRLNEELAQAKNKLAQEAELTRLKGELKEKQTTIEQRTLVYDTIANRTQKQSQSISQLASQARLSDDALFKEECRGRIAMLGAYIKRYANLMLLSQDSGLIEAGELGLSVSEVLRYLNLCGIPGEYFGSADCCVSANAALAAFEAFETLLEINYSDLKGVFVNISEQQDLYFKITLENLSQALPNELEQTLGSACVRSKINREDDVTYICFTLQKGGERV